MVKWLGYGSKAIGGRAEESRSGTEQKKWGRGAQVGRLEKGLRV